MSGICSVTVQSASITLETCDTTRMLPNSGFWIGWPFPGPIATNHDVVDVQCAAFIVTFIFDGDV